MKPLLWAFILFIFTASVQAQTGRLTIFLTDDSLQPVSSASVLLDSAIRATGDPSGTYIFTDVPRGAHTLYLSSAGYDPVKKEISLSGDKTHLSVTLHRSTHRLAEVIIDDVLFRQRKQITQLSTETVGENFIRRHTGGSLMQTLERLPGISSIGIGSSSSKPLIRGLGFNQVAVIENGIRQEGQQWGVDHGLEIDQNNVDKVEISKGPESFLYGSDALGGAIQIQSLSYPQPHTLGGSVDIVGKSNNHHLGSSVNLYGRSRQWFFNLRTTYMNYGDYRVPANEVYPYTYTVQLHKHYVRNTAGREFDNAVSFGYIGKRIKSSFYLTNVFDKSGFFANAHGLEPRNVDEALHDKSNRDVQLPYQQVSHTKITNKTEWNAGLHRFVVDIGFQNNDRDEYSQYVSHGYMPPVYPSDMPYPSTLERHFEKNTWSLNLSDRISFDKHQLTYGINTEYQHNKIGGWGFLIPEFMTRTLGGFVYDKYFLNDKWMLQGALRFDYGRTEVDDYFDWFESAITVDGTTHNEPLQRANAFAKNMHSTTWSAGVNYSLEKWIFTFNIGKGFRMPIAKELASNGVNYHYFRYEKGNPGLKPEESYQMDAGAEWKTARAHLLVTPYFNYFTNYIYLNPTAGYDNFYGAGNQIFEYTEAKVLRAGTEIKAGYRITNQWNLDVSGEYVYNRQLSGNKKNYPLPFTPPALVLFTLSYNPGILPKYLYNTSVYIDAQFAAPQNNIVPPEKKTPGYNVWALAVSTQVQTMNRPIDINLSIRNIFNQKYFSHTSFYRLIELPEQGRNIILSAKIPFNLKKS